MKVIPAIDLKDGQCVRLQKGDYGTAHKVAENAVETARRFLEGRRVAHPHGRSRRGEGRLAR